ncbi:MAG: hypothetical protein K9M51_03305 [Candidatus Gracilibacteria bacterium]|nr:hypothetical protein [Candidatus Gracilibacteria bacterium]
MNTKIAQAPGTASRSQKKYFTIGSIAPIDADDAAIFLSAVEAACELGFRVQVLSVGDTAAGKQCMDLAEKYPEQCEVLESVPGVVDRVLDRADVALFCASPDKKLLQKIISKAVVPVLPEECGVLNFDAQRETGAGFTFEPGHRWSLVAALVRASENRKFSYDWKTIQGNLEKMKSGNPPIPLGKRGVRKAKEFKSGKVERPKESRKAGFFGKNPLSLQTNPPSRRSGTPPLSRGFFLKRNGFPIGVGNEGERNGFPFSWEGGGGRFRVGGRNDKKEKPEGQKRKKGGTFLYSPFNIENIRLHGVPRGELNPARGSFQKPNQN